MRVRAILIFLVPVLLTAPSSAEVLHFKDGRAWEHVRVLSKGEFDLVIMQAGEVLTVRAAELTEADRIRLGLRVPPETPIRTDLTATGAKEAPSRLPQVGTMAAARKSTSPVVVVAQNPESACIIMSNARGVGTGFILQRRPGDCVLVSNQHVIDGSAPHRYEAADGSLLKPLQGWMATDRDLVMFRIDGGQLQALEIEPDVDAVALGEKLLIFGNSSGEGLRLSHAELLRKTRTEIEVSGGIVPGNSGGPILREKTGRVIGVSTYVTIQTGEYRSITDLIEAAIMPKVRCFGVRIDSVENPAEFDLRRFTAEGAALEADEQRMERALVLLVLMLRRSGARPTSEMQQIAANADQELVNTVAILRDGGLYPGTVNPVYLREFRRAADPLFSLEARPTSFIHKARQQELIARQRKLLSLYAECLAAIPVR